MQITFVYMPSHHIWSATIRTENDIVSFYNLTDGVRACEKKMLISYVIYKAHVVH